MNKLLSHYRTHKMTELEKPHIKTRADPGGLFKWYLLIIQETDHFNFIHSLSDNINRKKWEDSTIPQYYLGTQTRKQEEKGRQKSILLLHTDAKVLNKTLANWIY